jgi:hypothetical protein
MTATSKETISAKLWRKHRVSPEMGLKIFAHFATLTQFSRIRDELGIDLTTINAVRVAYWQDDFARLLNEVHPQKRSPLLLHEPHTRKPASRRRPWMPFGHYFV